MYSQVAFTTQARRHISSFLSVAFTAGPGVWWGCSELSIFNNRCLKHIIVLLPGSGLWPRGAGRTSWRVIHRLHTLTAARAHTHTHTHTLTQIHICHFTHAILLFPSLSALSLFFSLSVSLYLTPTPRPLPPSPSCPIKLKNLWKWNETSKSGPVLWLTWYDLYYNLDLVPLPPAPCLPPAQLIASPRRLPPFIT